MKKFYAAAVAFVLAFALFSEAEAQRSGGGNNDSVQETYTGTIVSFGNNFSARTVTRTFSLYINKQTSDQQAQSFLATLQEGGQNNLLRAIAREDAGRFSVGGDVGVPVNVVRESLVDGRRRIFVVFERSPQFAELRGGYRSLDYPFGVIEMFVDERTGKGEGTFIAAAKIRWTRDEKTNQYQVEIENFATFPARLLGVLQRNRRAS